MAQGIRLPLRAKNGRLEKLSKDGYIKQIVTTALFGMDSDNPFQTLGLGEWMIFGINDAMEEGQIKDAVVRIFDSLKADQLAKLKEGESSITFKHEEGDMRMSVDYIDMETQEGKSLDVPIPPSGE